MKYPSNYEEPRFSCDMEKHVTYKESGLKTSPLKECVQVVAKSQLSPCITTAANFCLKDDVKGVHNKENNQHNVDLDEVNLGCEAFEDSGFLSLQNSQIEDFDNIKELEKSPGQDIFSPSTPLADYHNKAKHTVSKLPILKFQHAVCQELANSFKRTQSYDWSVISRIAEDSGLERVIGGHVGLECMDVLKALLERDMKHILTRILRLLGDVDLISCRKVSKTWRKVICQDKSALCRCDQAKERLGDPRTSAGLENVGSLTRDAALSRVVMSCMQRVASTPIQKSTYRMRSQREGTQTLCCSQQSRFREYQEAASLLKQHESLKPCKRCGSPAKHNADAMRATCTRLSCAFDFCTLCQGPFHGSSACQTGLARGPSSSRANPILIGSARSKRNVRRL
ncbi:F-box only protein 5 [Salvelinus namaycush]|uniref:F-box only protein 5 n=1 Tax=Salvelinus namaycush TaxID=8040 RepID=A0A8U0P2R2_SALNM|nr:F-box only protein 5 [Salvelinus namaycush]